MLNVLQLQTDIQNRPSPNQVDKIVSKVKEPTNCNETISQEESKNSEANKLLQRLENVSFPIGAFSQETTIPMPPIDSSKMKSWTDPTIFTWKKGIWASLINFALFLVVV